MADPDECLTYAEHCLAIARMVGNREYRITLREMAAEWTKVASTVDREQSDRRPTE